MNKPYHIHAVLDMIGKSETPLTRGKLLEGLEENFGPSARFTSCSDQVFGIEEVIPFLHSRRKIREKGGYIVLLGSSCNH